jgi:DNA-binding MarR family transcriptional regulator
LKTQVSDVKQLNRRELAAWRGFIRVHASLLRDLDRELEEAHGLPLTHYEVLLHLANAPDGRLRMSDLASSVLLSQSGVSRLVDRLERVGQVVRQPCPEDRRVLYAQLTDAGRTRLAEARPTHLAGVRARFLAHFDDAELDDLAEAWERVHPGITE